VKVCDRIGPDWDRLADHLEIPTVDRGRFQRGRESYDLWLWLERRARLGALPAALRDIGRPDLVEVLVVAGAARSGVLSEKDDPARGLRVLDTAFFDLTDLRNVIEEELENDPGPVAFVVTQPEEMFVTKLCEWFEHCVDDIAQRPAVSLNPLQGGVDTALRHIHALRPVLEVSSVICGVNVHGSQVRPADVLRFWDEIRQRFHDIERWPVLLVLIHADEMSVDGMVALPSPRFGREHVREWGRVLLVNLEWQQSLLKTLTTAVVEYADNDGTLDVRLVYEALGGVVDDVRNHADWIRGELEKGSYLAHPA
jgi:hypothetical protein